MTSIVLAQHFFSSVQAELSPIGRRGYQTILCTRGLSSESVQAIEARAVYTNSPGDPLKRQFYPLPGGLYAVSNTVALRELDEFGRKGRYLTHTLIMDKGALSQMGLCPLDLLTQFSFLTQLEGVFALSQAGSGYAPPVKIDVRIEWVNRALRVARSWSSDELAQLGRLGWQSEHMVEQGDSVVLLGSDQEQLDVLALIFLLARPGERGLLSFDTHSLGCNWGRNVHFWAQGYSEQPDRRITHQISLPGHQISVQLSDRQDGIYAAWLIQQVRSYGIDGSIVQKQEWAARLESVLQRSSLADAAPPTNPIPAEFIEAFARQNATAVGRCWSSHLPQDLSPELLQSWSNQVSAEPKRYLQVLLEGVQIADIQWFLLDKLLEPGAVPHRRDRTALEKWIKANGDAALCALLPLWDRDERAWGKALDALEEEDYALLVTRLLKWNEPPMPMWMALTSRHVHPWIRHIAPFIPPGDWRRALPVLEKIGDSAVDALSEVILLLGSDSQSEIIKWIKGYKGSAPHLHQALSHTYQSKQPQDKKNQRKIWPF